MLSPNIFNILFVFPLLNILVAFYKVFELLNFPGPLGWVIISLTFLIKAFTHPFFKKQIESAKKIQELRPELEKLAKKYKNNREKLQKAQIELYQKAGVNPAVGCLLPIIQIPIFIGLYRTFIIFLNLKSKESFEELNRVLFLQFLKLSSMDPVFLGLDLTLSPLKGGNVFYYSIPVITGLLQYYMGRISSKQYQSKEEKKMSDFQKAFQTQYNLLLPFFIGWISLNFPVGLSLYWNFFSLLSIWQMRKVKNQL